MGAGQYILNSAGEPVLLDDLPLWAQWMEEHPRRIALDRINDLDVSTVFLGLDFSYPLREFFAGRVEGADPPRPLLWETMLFTAKSQGHVGRTSTRAEAVAQHEHAVWRLLVGDEAAPMDATANRRLQRWWLRRQSFENLVHTAAWMRAADVLPNVRLWLTDRRKMRRFARRHGERFTEQSIAGRRWYVWSAPLTKEDHATSEKEARGLREAEPGGPRQNLEPRGQGLARTGPRARMDDRGSEEGGPQRRDGDADPPNDKRTRIH